MFSTVKSRPVNLVWFRNGFLVGIWEMQFCNCIITELFLSLHLHSVEVAFVVIFYLLYTTRRGKQVTLLGLCRRRWKRGELNLLDCEALPNRDPNISSRRRMPSRAVKRVYEKNIAEIRVNLYRKQKLLLFCFLCISKKIFKLRI